MLQIKIHNVLHDERDSTPSNIETVIAEWIESSHRNVEVEDVRVAWGHTNSPIILKIKNSDLRLDAIHSVVREAVKGFGTRVDGVDVDKCVNDRNIIMKNA